MTDIVAVGTYLPPWEKAGRRVKGFDEDALTMAVAAGRAADPEATAQRVVLVSRDFPLLEGGNSAVLLAALSLDAGIPVSEVLGGGPAALDQVLGSPRGTLVIGSDDNDAAVGAVAVLTGESDTTVAGFGRRNGSLPLQSRDGDGVRSSYADPRLQREVGVKGSLESLDIPADSRVAAVAGVSVRTLDAGLDAAGAVEQTAGITAAALRALVAAIEQNTSGLVLALEQSSVTAADLHVGSSVRITRDEASAQELPKTTFTQGNGIPISLPAYSRAFEPKIRWEAAVYEDRPGIDDVPLTPPRLSGDASGALVGYELKPLPRTGTVYTLTTIRIPVPDLPSPYSIAVVQLDDTPVRVLLKVAGVPAGETDIGEPGAVVLRRLAIRAGIPDYGYAFWPGKQEVTA